MSESIERKSLPVLIADKLENEICSGQLLRYLPGRRILAKRFGVNEKTAASAIDILEERDLLAPVEVGKKRKINDKTVKSRAKQASKAKSKRLLILHQANSALCVEDVLLLRDVQDIWESQCGPVSWARVDFGRYQKPGSMLDKLIENYSADVLVMMMPTVGWCEEAIARIPTFQFGGPYGGEAFTMCGYSVVNEMLPVVQYLAKLGHKRIFIPSMDQLQRDAHIKALVSGLGELADPTIAAEALCPHFVERVPQAWRMYWKKYLSEIRPTAVVVHEDCGLMSLYGFCAEAGIRIPRDLTVITMNYEERFEWMQPQPTMMRFPAKRAIVIFKDWIKGGFRPTGRHFLKLDMIKGESVGPPRKVN